MTLLISAFTNNNAFLASDRRLAYINGSGKVVPGDDDSCKLIYYDRGFLFAYTGLSNLGGKIPTDVWIAYTLQHAEQDWNPVKAIEHLALKTKEQVSKYPAKKMRFFTAICVGWEYFKDFDELQPAFGHVSTYLDVNLQRVPLQEKNGSSIVYWSFRRIEKNKIPFVFTAGQEICYERLIRLKRHLRKCMVKNVSQSLILDSLYNEIIHASEKNKGKAWIGKGVLSAAISLESVRQEHFIITHGDYGTGQQFRYYSANNNNYVFKGLHVVQPGGSAIIHFQGGRLEASDQEHLKRQSLLPEPAWHMPWTQVYPTTPS